MEAGIVLAAAGSAILAALALSVAFDRSGRKNIPAFDKNWKRLTLEVKSIEKRPSAT